MTMTLKRLPPRDAATFDLAFRPGRGRHALDAWIALPRDPRPGARPLVAVHGIGRGAEEQALAHAGRAAAAGRAVIAPLFDATRWKGFQRAVTPRRADAGLIGLIEELTISGQIPECRFDLAGFSGGAQFAHRFAMLYPHRLGRLSVCAAGWWTMPTAATEFPYGLGGDWGARLAAGLERFLGLEIAVSVGAFDNRPDAATRSTPELDRAQGRDRLSRARAWVEALRAEAASRHLPPPPVTLTVLPGCGHAFAACAAAGLVDLDLRDPR